MPGRPPKPTALKLLEGNPGKRRINAREPKPKAGAPEPPAWLAPAAQPYWTPAIATLEEMNVLTVADQTAVALLCNALAEYVEAAAEVAANGLTFHDARYDKAGDLISETRKANPAVAIRADAWRRVNLMLQQFGLTASSRAKLHVEPKEDEDEFDVLMRRKR